MSRRPRPGDAAPPPPPCAAGSAGYRRPSRCNCPGNRSNRFIGSTSDPGRLACAQILRRHLEIEIVERPIARTEGVIVFELLDLPEVRARRQQDLSGLCELRPVVAVGEDQHVSILVMLEPVENSDMLHQ